MILKSFLLSISFLIVPLLVHLNITQVDAQDSTSRSQILNTSVTISNTNNSKIEGSISLDNASNKGFDNYSLVVKLLSPGRAAASSNTGLTRTGQGLIIDFVKLGPFSIKPGQKQDQNFELKYPSSVISGNYVLTAEVIDQDSSSQSITSANIPLSGSGTFLNIDPSSCRINAGSEVYDYYEGPNINPQQPATASCIINNPTDERISAKGQLVYAVNSVTKNLNTAKETETQQETFEPNQNKTVSFQIPVSLAPQVYEGLFFLTDAAGEKISVNIPFRWIITGPSVTIYNLDLDKTYYHKNETAKLSVGITPSADLSWRGDWAPFTLGQGTDLVDIRLDLKITDNGGQVCSQKSEKLPPTTENNSWSNLVFEMQMTRDCPDPVVEVNIISEGTNQPLGQMKIGIASTMEDIESSNPFLAKFRFLWVWFFIGALAIIGVIVYFVKFRKKQNPPDNPPLAPPNASSVPVAVLVFLSFSLLGGTGYLMGSTDIGLLKHLGLEVVRAQEVVKQPINSSDANTKNIAMRTIWGGVSSSINIWGNARDFSQNNTGGDSSISVEPGCSKINITIKGSAGSDYTCYNWAPGLTVFPFIDGQPVKPENPISAILNEIWNPSPYNFTNSNNFSIMQFDDNGQRQASFSITPNLSQSTGNHTLTLQVGVSHIVKHDRVELFQSSFFNNNDCGGVPCYILLSSTFACGVPACNVACPSNEFCSQATDGCTSCIGGTCQKCEEKPAETRTVACPPGHTGSITETRTYACPAATWSSWTVTSNSCTPPPACGDSCISDSYCFGAPDGCTSCVPNDAGTGSVCARPPVCGSSCVRDSQCIGDAVRDGCTACVGGVCKIPPACGTACTTKAQCSGVKDGCSECLEGTCTNYSDNMCKCDGMVADIVYPSTSFNFEAFGKVAGTDAKKAEIADITFRLTRDNQVVAKSNPITPTIVENNSDKVRFKAAWSTAPPAVVRGATYRVFADVRCKPKKITASAAELADSSPVFNTQANPEEIIKPFTPKGLEWVVKTVSKLFNDGKVSPLVGEVLAQLGSPSPSPLTQSQSNLQLSKLNFVKLLDTDNCRFVMFKFDETLF